MNELNNPENVTKNKSVARWLFLITALAVVMVVLGGVVRLTESGLSMVDWHIVTGIVPPMSEQGWQDEFAKYQQTPEYQKINQGMALSEFKFIYYMEYAHRMLGRVIGLLYLLPFFYFWRKGVIRRTHLWRFASIGILLVFQGLFGWYMVKSGLIDMPRVSHYRLTGHLLLAFSFIALCLWTGLEWLGRDSVIRAHPVRSTTRRFALATLVALVVQITLGGLVAGLRAGLVSNTFPKMSQVWIPDFVWSMQPWFINFIENPFMVHFVHRWNGFFVFFLAGIMMFYFRREQRTFALDVTLQAFMLLLGVQIILGIFTVLWQVPVLLASLHQAVALISFMALLVVLFQARISAMVAGTSDLAESSQKQQPFEADAV